MNVVITPKSLCGNAGSIIASKSFAHRSLICAAFSDKETDIYVNTLSDDMQATMNALHAFGADLSYDGEKIHVIPLNTSKRLPDAIADCGESGSTLRFLLPVAGAIGTGAESFGFTGRGRLPQRPLSPLYEELVSHGMNLSPQGSFPLTFNGRIRSGEYRIAGNISSQYISGLLLSLPLLKEKSNIIIEGKLESTGYVDITESVMKKYGVHIKKKGDGYEIPADVHYQSPGKDMIEGDWSSAAFWMCAGAMSEDGICCEGLKYDSLQGDRKIADILESFGAVVEKEESGITVKKENMHGIEIDASNIPDLVPVMSVVAASIEGTTRIRGIERLRYKESDRIESTISMLASLGVKSEAVGEGADLEMVIYGCGKIPGGTVDSCKDHRIAMSAAIASCCAEREVIILGAECSSKSYPDFFEVFEKLGGCAEKKS